MTSRAPRSDIKDKRLLCPSFDWSSAVRTNMTDSARDIAYEREKGTDRRWGGYVSSRISHAPARTMTLASLGNEKSLEWAARRHMKQEWRTNGPATKRVKLEEGAARRVGPNEPNRRRPR
jgi:hypothetical protein